MSEPDTLLVLAASYDTLMDAEVDYEAIEALYDDVGASHYFDAAVVVRDGVGKLDVVKKHEEPTGHGAARGLRWGLAIGAASAILPDQIAANIKAVNSYLSKQVESDADELARQLHEAAASDS